MTLTALITAALADARNMPADAMIYVDENLGGFAWQFHGTDHVQSGPIGYAAEHYFGSDIQAVAQALTDAGYTVI